MNCEIFETSANGNTFKEIQLNNTNTKEEVSIAINPNVTFQKITGIGGSFTEATAYLLNKLSHAKKQEILNAYFSEEGANYSLTRTHIASCDFSLKNYTYAPVANDLELQHFSIEEDKNDLIPVIKEAQKISKNGFNIIASPWTAPPWMKDNNSYVGGKLKQEYQGVYALYFQKYLEAYKKLGISIWGITPVNEPHGNGNNWESMHFTPEEMTTFVQNYLGPQLEKSEFNTVKILGYDQNRAGLKEWVNTMYATEASSKYFSGTAIHWYESTYEVFPDDLNYAHFKAPNKHLIETEGCIDAEIPVWKNDAWYWKKEATDWGWDWASEQEKYLHPKYAPVHRYANDIIGCLNNYVDGWVDWNMVLDKQGGPNWFKNWCIAPVIVDVETDEVYYTPLYYVMKHFSKYIRPNATRIDFNCTDKALKCTAVKNEDSSIVVVLFNPTLSKKNYTINNKNTTISASINAEAIQTIVLK
ncbi:glycoside hydrolase family 30 beta sandwich domain-containing protein [Flavobacterium sp.]|uniref:glycoside hydrolase family 30 protein n=1 Tax=Flavobacterium sp. TaxID=239 RepID=UPI003527584A